MALLMESTAIQTHWPRFNRAQKRKPQSYAIFSYEDRQGLKHLAYDLEKRSPQHILRLPSAKHCQELLRDLCEKSETCPKFYHLLADAKSCIAHPLKQCNGECKALSNPQVHNEAIVNSIEYLSSKKENQLLLLPGRSPEEKGFLVLEGGQYRGYGFAPLDEGFSHFEELEPYMTPCPNTPETQGILLSYLLRSTNDAKIVGKPLNISG